MRLFCAVLLTALGATVAIGSPMNPAPRIALSASAPAPTPTVSDLRLPDPDKELRHLSKDLKLKKDQRIGVSSILQERTREIQLLFDIQALSQEYREQFAAKVIADSDAQIATLLRNKQKQKFDRELARQRDRY